MAVMKVAAAHLALSAPQMSDAVLVALITAVVGGIATVLTGLIRGWFDLRIAHVNRQPAGHHGGHDAPRTASWTAVIVTAGAAVLLVNYWNQLTEDDAVAVSGETSQPGTTGPPAGDTPGAGEVSVPPSTPATPTPTPATPTPSPPGMSLEEEAEAFLAKWSEVARETRDPRVFDGYWRFPGDWYNAEGLQSAEELVATLPPLRTSGPRTCVRQAPEIESIEDDGTLVSITARVDWEAPATGKRGSSPVMYDLERSVEGEAFRIRDVSEPPRTPPACR